MFSILFYFSILYVHKNMSLRSESYRVRFNQIVGRPIGQVVIMNIVPFNDMNKHTKLVLFLVSRSVTKSGITTSSMWSFLQ